MATMPPGSPPRQWPRSGSSQTAATIPESNPATGATTGSRSEPVSGQRSDRLIPPIRITAAIRRQYANHGKPTAGIQPISSRITAATNGQTVSGQTAGSGNGQRRGLSRQTRPARDFLSGNFPFFIRESRFSSGRDFLKQPRNRENFISGNYPGILIETGENDTKQEKTVIPASSGVLSCKSLKIKVQKNGGGGWIRTIEVSDSRFTVCPLWPLGNPTT